MSTTKKLLQTVALAGAVTATGAVATTAHADATVPAASDQATTDAQTQLNNLKSQQQASEAAKAQDNQNQMSAATSAANAKIADLNNQMSANNASQAAANSAALASGTAQINAAAKSATDAENASYSQAVASQQAANSQALAEASKNIVTPEQKQAQTSAENASFQAAVNAAHAAYNAANTQLKSEYDTANQKINDQIATIQNRQTADQQQKLTEATATVDRQINDAAKAAQDATAKVNADQTAVANAQTTVNAAQSDLDNASQKLNDAKQEENKGNKQLNNDYPHFYIAKKASSNYAPSLDPSQYVTQDGFSWQDTDPVDQSTKLHFDANGNLSEEDQNIANVFAANIINHMRSQIGSPLVKVSAEGNAMQKRLMDLDQQLTGMDDMTLHHTIDATQQLMNSGAIITRAENAAESFGSGSVHRDVPTVADLKNEIYNSIDRWISERGNVDPNQPFGHRYILLGVDGYGIDNPTVALTTRVHGNRVYCTFLDVYDLPGTQHYVSLENNGLPTDSSKPAVDLNALQAAVDAAKTKLDHANAALAAAKSQLATDQAAAKTASAKLNQLKTGRDQAIKDLVGAADPIADQIASIQNQQTADQKQKLADATAKVDGQINDAAKAAQDATAKVNTDQNAVNSAQTAVNTAQSNFDNASQKLNAAKQETQNNKQLSTDYPQYVVLKAQNENGYNVGLTTDNWQDTDPVDQSTKLHFDANGNLSEEDQNIANVFAANIINHMRKQIGSPLVKVSSEGNTMQKRLMDLDQQLTGMDDMTLHHTIDATQQLMNSGAIVTRAENAAESFGTGSVDRDAPTVADLKNEIYNSISRWLSEEGNVDPNQPAGHRYILLGVNGYGIDNPTVALTTRVHGNRVYCTFLDVYDLPGTQHYVSLENNGLPTDASKPAVDINALQAAVDAAKTKLDQANAALAAAKSQLAADQAAAKTASAKLSQMKANRDQAIKDLAGTASSIQDQINALKQKANDLANSYQAKFKAENDQYQQKLASLKADHQKKLDAINAQPSDVNALKAQLDQKLEDLKAQHEANLKKINDDAQAKIEALKAKLSDNTAENQPLLDQIQAIKDGLTKQQQELNAKLETLKADDAAAYAKLHDQLFPKNTDVVNGKTDHMTTGDGTEIVLPGEGNIAENATITATAYPTREQYREGQQEAGNLPQTGNANSAAVIALGAISAMLGLGLAARKQRY